MIIRQGLITVLNAISDVLTAGVAIISFSLLIYSVTFSLRDRVTNTFTLLIVCIVVIFGADAFITVTENVNLLNFVIRVHWLGIIFLPTAYFHFSDSILAITGKPSRGKRRIAGNLFTGINLIFLYLLFTDSLVGELIINKPPAPYLLRTTMADIFSIFFVSVMGLSWYNFIRAYRRSSTHTGQRRMLYLVISAMCPALGSFPYLLYGSEFAESSQIIFWIISISANLFVYISLITMAYSVSFFGFPWTDRLIKSRLFRWVLRGPIAASLTLGITTLISRLGDQFDFNFTSALVILGMVSTIVLFEYLVTLFAPIWERIFFSGSDRLELEKVRILEDRLLTTNDIQQFLEMILASLCDRLQISGAAFVVTDNSSPEIQVRIGSFSGFEHDIGKKFEEYLSKRENLNLIENLEDFYLIPVKSSVDGVEKVYGGVIFKEEIKGDLDAEKKTAVLRLIDRAVFALREREEQERILASFEMLVPQTSVIQNLIAVSRFNQQRLLNGIERIEMADMEQWVKEALSQIWGGPKIALNPLLQLKLVQERMEKYSESPVNALREILREATNRLKPEGQRQYTNEWLLFNLIDLKFFEGWKVKDIAYRLAVSEADFYRKQRAAITSLSRQIIDMERSILD